MALLLAIVTRSLLLTVTLGASSRFSLIGLFPILIKLPLLPIVGVIVVVFGLRYNQLRLVQCFVMESHIQQIYK